MAAASFSSPRPFGLVKTIALRCLAVATSGAISDVTAAPTLTAGAGAPSATEPNGSLWLRTDGSDGDDSLYMRIGGAWVAIKGQVA